MVLPSIRMVATTLPQERACKSMPDGTYAGTIFVPQYPVNITFGGPNNDVLYIVGESSVWSIQTKVHGFRQPAGMN
jgi:sugar lactone lactonase YvrE